MSESNEKPRSGLDFYHKAICSTAQLFLTSLAIYVAWNVFGMQRQQADNSTQDIQHRVRALNDLQTKIDQAQNGLKTQSDNLQTQQKALNEQQARLDKQQARLEDIVQRADEREKDTDNTMYEMFKLSCVLLDRIEKTDRKLEQKKP